MIEILALGVTVLAFIATLFFILTYNRVRWERSPEGVNAMLVSLAVLLLSTAGIVRRLIANPVAENFLVMAAWSGVAILMLHRTCLVRSAQREHYDDNDDNDKTEREE